MTDGWNWRQSPTPPAATPQGGPGSPWWSDALADPWRDPYAPSAVVVPSAPQSTGPEPEPVRDPRDRPRALTPVLLICLVTALLAGGLGGTLGYVFATRNGVGGGTQLGAAPAPAPSSAQRPVDSNAGVVGKVQPSVVTVRVSGAIGSGFVVSQEGYVITNDHVVANGGDTISVLFSDGSTAPATLVGRETESDIAVIKVSRKNLTAVQLGDSDSLAVGDPVFAFGSPLNLVGTVTEGIVSALDRTLQAPDTDGTTRYYAAIQTDAAVNQGNSGGPLVDGDGRVIGVNSVIRSLGTAEAEAGNIGLAFAIPINQARRIAEDIIDTGKARRTVIGAEVSTSGSTGTGGGTGARLRSVQPVGPAATAGLKSGDVVTKIAGHVIEDGVDLIALVRKYAPGATVPVEYRRGTKTQTASVTLAADAK